ncbi:MAG: cysteine desulfurase-like protein [Actinomycetota bacterium]|nr:cysteine desulfurase-like protein [Actinomycetota bacterium]
MQVALDVEAVRARFGALQRPYAFLDAPAGTQVPDEVIQAIALYLRESNANVGGAFETSRRTTELVAKAHEAAAGFLGCSPGETIFGPSMTNLNFMLTRTLARELRVGDEILVTRLDHDANVAPWLELAHDIGVVVRFVDFDPADGSLDRADLERQLSGRTRVVAFPLASNALGTLLDAHLVCELAHRAGALAWIDAVHYAPHGEIDVARIGADVLLCSPYKFFGPHLGLAFVERNLLERWRPYKVRPAPGYETGTAQHELLAGFVAAVEYLDSIGWSELTRHERDLGHRFLDALPENLTLYGPPTIEGRVPTFAFNVVGRTPAEVATHLGERGIFVWHGNYYALEVMRRLGLEDGAVRVGFVHYNTAAEVDRLLDELRRL